MSKNIDFVTGVFSNQPKKKSKRLSLYYKLPKVNNNDVKSVIQEIRSCPRTDEKSNRDKNIEDGLYVSSEGPLTSTIVKPYKLMTNNDIQICEKNVTENKKLLELAIREVRIENSEDLIKSVAILYKNKLICRIMSPFNRKLYKLLISNNTIDNNNLLIQVQMENGKNTILPFPLPTRDVKDKKLQISFSINNDNNILHGVLICTVTLTIKDSNEVMSPSKNLQHICKSSNDPNDPQNNLSLTRVRSQLTNKKIDYFLLQDLSLQIDDIGDNKKQEKNGERREKLIFNSVISEPEFSLRNLTFGLSRRTLRPLSGSNLTNVPIDQNEVLSVTILRGVQLPLREESGQLQPIIMVQWGELTQNTRVAEGSTPVWQQTLHFTMPKNQREHTFDLKLSLFDQHPSWGYQWLGEASIPLDFQSQVDQYECWTSLSSLRSPKIRFGYKLNVDCSHSRIYVMIKIKKRLENEENANDHRSLQILTKSIQRCLTIPYKIDGITNPEDLAHLTALLMPLPQRYGILNPRQALKLNKVDYYGRAALLACLLQALEGIEGYVALGASQTKKLAVFVLMIKTNSEIKIWDPENGNQYTLNDSKCSLIKIGRLINHQNIWKNLQNVTMLSNLRFNLKSGRDWLPMGPNLTSREPLILELDQIPQGRESDVTCLELENEIKDKLSQWRSAMGFITIFNRHASSVFRAFLLTLTNDTNQGEVNNESNLKQLCRVYDIYGFILNLRCVPNDELINFIQTTKIQEITGPVEFSVVCNFQRYVGKISSLWLTIAVLRNRH